MSAAGLIDSFADLTVLVVGDAMLDSYIHGTAGTLSREAPVPVVNVRERRDVPGGAANAAANVRRLGGSAILLSAVGDDPEGALLREALAASGIASDQVLVQAERRTLAKHRVLAESQMLVRFDQGTTEPMAADAENALVGALTRLFRRSDAVVVSDYGYGVLTPRVIHTLGELQAAAPRAIVVDSKNLRAYRDAGVTAVKPNYQEALALLRATGLAVDADRGDAIAAEGERILDVTGAQIAAVTLDSEGAVVIERGRPPYRTYAKRASGSTSIGAGDTFVATLALALAAGAHTPAAADLASAAAAIVVAKEGTTCCSAAELREHLVAGEKRILDLDRLLALAESYREQGRRVVFTNGCFDILHRGHITYLSRAKALGDLLVVGVNSDDSVRRLKGSERPINSIDDRVEVLAALSCVDQIVVFDEDTPADLIRTLRPDVYVKGGDYTRETLPEAPLVESLGGKVRILPYVEDQSTTSVIARIRRLDEPGETGVRAEGAAR